MRSRVQLWKRTLALAACVLLLPAFTVSAARAEEESGEWQLTGQVGGTTKALCLADKTLYIGSGLHVLAVDASDPSKLIQLGSSPLLPQFTESLVYDGNGKLYACCGDGGLTILDVKNPAEPRILGTLDTRGYTEGVALYGRYAVLADGPLGVQVADVSDPANPRIVSEAYSLAYTYAVTMQDGIVYAAGGGSGLFTIDLTDPLKPKEAGLLSLDGFQYDVKIVNGRLYTAGAWGGVHVLSLAVPLRPARIASASTPGWAMSLSADGSSLLVLDGADGALLYDVTGDQPTETSAVSFNGYSMTGTLNGLSAFVLDRDKGLIALDFTKKTDPRIVSRWMPLLDGRRLTVSGTTCYVAGGLSGLHVFDLSNAANPTESYWFDTGGGYANKTVADGDLLYLSAHLSTDEPLLVFDASDPKNLKKLSGAISVETTFGTAFRSFSVGNGYAYIAGEFADMAVNVQDPQNLFVAGVVQLGNPVNGDFSGNIFASSSNTELQLIDVSDPNNLKTAGIMEKSATGEAVRFINPTTILTSDNPGVCIVDVSNPAKPKKISELAVSGSIMEAFVDGTTAYLSCLGDGVRIVDISDLSHPALVGTIETLGLAYDCYAKDGLLVVADSYAGISVYQKGTAAGSGAQKPSAAAPLTLKTGETPYTTDFYMSSQQRPSEEYDVVITSAADSGPGTLREALEYLRANTTITFDPSAFPAENPATISLQSPLPAVNWDYLTIDASDAGVILDGSFLQSGNGLTIYSCYNRIMGLQIVNFPENGINIEGGGSVVGGNRRIGSGPLGQGNLCSGNGRNGIYIGGCRQTIQGNFVGVDSTGTKAYPNYDGIFVVASEDVTVGGIQPGEGNVVSGNEWINIDSWGDHTRIIGNFIGTDATGTKAVRTDTANNVVMESGVTNCVLGGTTPEERNIISGAQCGFVFSDPNSYQCSVIGNYIGTDVTGTKAIPNGSAGGPWTSSHHRIGGTRPGEGNLICGNAEGLTMNGFGAEENLILGNTLGLDANGKPLANEIGLGINMGQTHVVIGGYTAAEGNTFYGGAIALRISSKGIRAAYVAGNSITVPSGAGLMLGETADNFAQGNTFGKCGKNAIRIDYGTGNLLRANVFAGNKTDPMILLLEGGNASLAAPAAATAEGKTVSGTAPAFCLVEIYLFENGTATPLGFAAADASGNFTFTAKESLSGKKILLLASDAAGNTSAFSKPVAVR